jgi:hypothetical protein
MGFVLVLVDYIWFFFNCWVGYDDDDDDDYFGVLIRLSKPILKKLGFHVGYQYFWVITIGYAQRLSHNHVISIDSPSNYKVLFRFLFYFMYHTCLVF